MKKLLIFLFIIVELVLCLYISTYIVYNSIFNYRCETDDSVAYKMEDFDNLESISQDGQYVKLTFKDDVYKDIGLEELKNVYSDFDELRKPEV